MKTFGWIALVAGVIWTFITLNMDVSVATGYGGRVNNIGLMAAKQNYIIIGGFIVLCGLLMVILGNRNVSSGSGRAKCPYCAELISDEAVKCKHCGSDVTPTNGPGSKLDINALGFTEHNSSNEVILNKPEVYEYAKRLHMAMPSHSVLSVMVTNSSKLNELKSSMPPHLSKDFESLVEEYLKEIKEKR